MVVLEIKKRTARPFGSKREHVTLRVVIAGSVVFEQNSSEYGLTADNVFENCERFVESLRIGLASSGVQSQVLRSNF